MPQQVFEHAPGQDSHAWPTWQDMSSNKQKPVANIKLCRLLQAQPAFGMYIRSFVAFTCFLTMLADLGAAVIKSAATAASPEGIWGPLSSQLLAQPP